MSRRTRPRSSRWAATIQPTILQENVDEMSQFRKLRWTWCHKWHLVHPVGGVDVKSLDVALGVKLLRGTNVTVDQMSSGRSVRVEMSLGCSMGGCSVKVPIDTLSTCCWSSTHEHLYSVYYAMLFFVPTLTELRIQKYTELRGIPRNFADFKTQSLQYIWIWVF